MTDPLTVLHDQWVADYLDGRAGGVTSGGLPYPAPTDPVNQGAAAIQALAEAIDPKLNSYAIVNQTNTPQAASAWTCLPCTLVEEVKGPDLVAFSNGLKAVTAGLYRVDFVLQVNATPGGTITATAGVSTQEAAPGGFHRVSAYLGASSTILNGTWLLRRTAGQTIGGWFTHTHSTTIPVQYRRLSAQRVAN